MSERKTDPSKKRQQGRINNTLHLWEFLLELLEDERYAPLITWTRKEEREFKIKRQEDLARKWGRLKQRASMNYDKLSRALRYYYHKGIIKKVQGQRLVYKFDKLPYSYRPVKYNWPWKFPSEEQDTKPEVRDNIAPPISKAKPRPVIPISEEQVKPIKPDNDAPVVSTAMRWPVKPAKPDRIPPLVPITAHLPVRPALNSGKQSPVLPQSVPRNLPSEFSSFDCPIQRPSQVLCRSQIIFPPCSCMRSAMCAVRMIPDPKSVPVKVITRFV